MSRRHGVFFQSTLFWTGLCSGEFSSKQTDVQLFKYFLIDSFLSAKIIAKFRTWFVQCVYSAKDCKLLIIETAPELSLLVALAPLHAGAINFATSISCFSYKQNMLLLHNCDASQIISRIFQQGHFGKLCNVSTCVQFLCLKIGQ